MLYYIFKYLDQLDVPGAGLFQYISFRSGLAALLSLIITITFGKKLINILKKSQLKESIRDLGLKGQKEKEGHTYYGRYHHYFCYHHSYFIIGRPFKRIYYLINHIHNMDGMHWFC